MASLQEALLSKVINNPEVKITKDAMSALDAELDKLEREYDPEKEAFVELGIKTRQSSINSVKNPLPAPVICPHCAGEVALVNNSVIYGKPYGNWPYAYRCKRPRCNAYVGLHPYTLIPLGTLATASIRNARKKAKAAFNPLWESGQMSRSDAYRWLALQLGITNTEECHIAWFDVEQCNRVVAACESKQANV